MKAKHMANAKHLTLIIGLMMSVLTMSLTGWAALSKPANAYSWLLKCSGTEFVDEQNFKQFTTLIKTVAPDTRIFLDKNKPLSSELFGDLLLPQDMIIREKRFVTLMGAQPHFATQQGLVWIDTEKNESVVAVYTSYWHGKLLDNLCIGSKTFKSPEELPADFWTDFNNWSYLNRGDEKLSTYNFACADGTIKTTKLPVASH